MSRDNLIFLFNKHVDRNLENGGVVVSAGISMFNADKDASFDDIFSRADEQMYERKKELKSKKHNCLSVVGSTDTV